MTEKICSTSETEDERYLCCMDEIGEMIKRMVRNFQLMEKNHIKPLGFTMTQCYCLIEIFDHENLTMLELSERMKLNSSTMTRIVDKLVRDQYIRRDRSQSDRRIVIVNLTEKGLEAASQAKKVITDYYKHITYTLPKGSVEDILDSVSKLMDSFEESYPGCC